MTESGLQPYIEEAHGSKYIVGMRSTRVTGGAFSFLLAAAEGSTVSTVQWGSFGRRKLLHTAKAEIANANLPNIDVCLVDATAVTVVLHEASVAPCT